jgi:hypothetical protein
MLVRRGPHQNRWDSTHGRREIGMSEHPDAAVVRSAYEALSRGDMTTFEGLLHDDIVWHESAAGMEGDYRGRDETLAFLGKVFQESGRRAHGRLSRRGPARRRRRGALLRTSQRLADAARARDAGQEAV